MALFLILLITYLFVEIRLTKRNRGCCITTLLQLVLGTATLIAFLVFAFSQ